MSAKLENDIILKIENINKNYGELKVLKNNSLDVKVQDKVLNLLNTNSPLNLSLTQLKFTRYIHIILF